MLDNLKNKLTIYNQVHLLDFYNEISFLEQNELIVDINSIDFKLMKKLYVESYKDEVIDISKISPLTIMNKNDKNYNIGEQLIKSNKYAIVIMAGGSASRLGLNIPKGCIELDLNGKKISLFELFINQLKDVYIKYGTYINLYIMTNDEYDQRIKDFFLKKNYFNYDKKSIHFFKQHNLPILDIKGNVLLKNKYSILKGPNGNGDVFKSLKESNMLDDMIKKNIEFVLFSTTDNILVNLVDYSFIGNTIANNYKLATKTIEKENENELDWVFCKYNNKPYMLPSAYISKDLTNYKINNDFVYREKNITHHLVNINSVVKFANIDLKYHRSYKKNMFIDVDGNVNNGKTNNSFKFEKFIFDAFYYEDDMLLYRVNKNEFFPIKTKEDLKSVSEILKKNN